MANQKYHFSTSSQEKLSSCALDLQTIFNEVIKRIDCAVICGHRGEVKQNIAYNTDKSDLRWPHSKHNGKPSRAVDVVPYPIDWEDRTRFYYFAGIVMGIAERLKLQGKVSHDIRWGRDWDGDNVFTDQKFNDLPHFELI